MRAGAVYDIYDQIKLFKDDLDRGTMKDIILQYIKDIKEEFSEDEDGVSLQHIEFIPEDNPTPGELKDMFDMKATDIPF